MPQSPDTAVLSIAHPMTRAEACEVLSEHTRDEIDAWLTRYPPRAAPFRGAGGAARGAAPESRVPHR